MKPINFMIPSVSLDYCKQAWHNPFPPSLKPDGWTLVFAGSGIRSASVSLATGRTLYTLPSDPSMSSVFLVPPGATLRWRFDKDRTEVIRFHFTAQELHLNEELKCAEFSINQIGNICFSLLRILDIAKTLRYRVAFQDVCEAFFSEDASDRFYAGLAFPSLLALLVKTRFPRFYSRPIGDATMAKAIFENENQGRKTIREAAADLGRSAQHLRKVFTEKFGKLPSQFRDDIRLKRALSLIRNTNIPFCEIGQTLGMKGRGYLSAYVKRKTGRTPRELRRERTMGAAVEQRSPHCDTKGAKTDGGFD